MSPRPGRVLLLVLPLLFLACVSAPPEPVGPVAPPQLKRTQGFVADAFRLIAAGSPESLRDGFRILDERTDLSDYAADLRFLASWLYRGLYGALPDELPGLDPPPGSSFGPLLDDIEKGVYPVVRMEEVSYLFFLLPPLSLLYSESSAALDIAYESLTAGWELNPRGVLPQYLLGVVEERRGNSAEAITWYISALQETTACYPAALGLARLYLADNRFEEADIVLIEVRARIEPTPDYYYLRGRTDLALQRYEEAVAGFLAAGEEDPRNLIGAAEAQFRRKEYEQARLLLQRAGAWGAESVQGMLLEAKVLRALGERLRATALLNRAQELYPDNQGIKDLYGQLLLETGRTSEGRSVLELEAPEGASDASRLLLLMENAVDAELFEEARIYFEQAIVLSREPRILEEGAKINAVLGQEDQAMALYDELIARYPDRRSYSLAALSTALDFGDENRGSLEVRRLQGIELTSADESRLMVGRARLAASARERRQYLEQALFLDVKNVDALLRLAELYTTQGDPGRAGIYLRQLERMSGLGNDEKRRLAALKERI